MAKKKKPPGGSGNSSRSSTPASSNREKHRQLPRPRSPVEVQTVGTKNMILEEEIWKRGSGCRPICHVIDCSFTVHCICTNLIKWLMRSVNTDLKPMLLIWVWLSISQCKKKLKNCFTMSHYTNTQIHKFTNKKYKKSRLFIIPCHFWSGWWQSQRRPPLSRSCCTSSWRLSWR